MNMPKQYEILYRNIQIYWKWIKDKRRLPLSSHHFELYRIIHQFYWNNLKCFPDLVYCAQINDKINWLKLFDQHEDMIRCCDKILVREYIAEKVGKQYLNKLYQVHDHFSEIDFSSLPNSFVIKTNHDSGTVILVKDKEIFDKKAAEEKIEKALAKRYGWENGEWAYSYINRKVFVEEYLDPDSADSPPDYKFFCAEGKAKFCHYIYDRNMEHKYQVLDLKGIDLKIEISPTKKYGNTFSIPSNWSEMIDVSERLSRAFKFVRVDLYNVNNQIFCGELTFWPRAGIYQGKGQYEIGKLIDFDRKTHRPYLVSQLEKNRKSQEGK